MATERKIEVELKYEVTAPGGADRYLVAPELGPFMPAGQVRSVRLEDRYVDSADWALARAGFAARLRLTSRGTLISVKAQATSGVRMQRREEIEGPADAGREPADWPASRARTVILELCGDAPLVELLTIRQLRRVRRLEAGDTRAELSLDEVEVFSNESLLDRFEELEVELKKGGEEPLAALADLFDRDENLRPVSRSKLDRAVVAIKKALPSMPQTMRKLWEAAPPELRNGKARTARPKDRATAEGAASPGVAAEIASEPVAPTAMAGRLEESPAAEGASPKADRPSPGQRPSHRPVRATTDLAPSASWRRTACPKPPGRSSSSISPGCRTGRPAPAAARTWKTCTTCGSRPGECERRGESSTTPSKRPAPSA